jgi:GntR family transcriptional regulator
MDQLRIDKSEAFSVHTQLVEQFKFQIALSIWEPGRQLPSVREVATSLGVNYNTVRAVYQQLERDHYVVTDQGRGTFVTKVLPQQEMDQYGTLLDVIDEALTQAQTLGISLDIFARTAYVRAKLYNSTPLDVHVLFAECNQPDLDYFMRSIERGTAAHAEGYVLDELPQYRAEFFAQFDFITTTLSHVAELQEMVGAQQTVLGLRIEPSYADVLVHLASLPKKTPVGLICATQESAEKMKRAIFGAGVTQVQPLTGGVNHPGEIEAVFEAAEHIYVSRHGLSLHQGAWPERHQVHEYVTDLDPIALRLLRHQLVRAHTTSYARRDGNQ